MTNIERLLAKEAHRSDKWMPILTDKLGDKEIVLLLIDLGATMAAKDINELIGDIIAGDVVSIEAQQVLAALSDNIVREYTK